MSVLEGEWGDLSSDSDKMQISQCGKIHSHGFHRSFHSVTIE